MTTVRSPGTDISRSMRPSVLSLICHILFEKKPEMFGIMIDPSDLLVIGWWNIGVELTLSPFHTAKALDASLLSGVNSAAGSSGVVDEVGDMRLKLGAVDLHRSTTRSRIGLDSPERVFRPLKGAGLTD